jgi:hypothetical protein
MEEERLEKDIRELESERWWDLRENAERRAARGQSATQAERASHIITDVIPHSKNLNYGHADPPGSGFNLLFQTYPSPLTSFCFFRIKVFCFLCVPRFSSPAPFPSILINQALISPLSRQPLHFFSTSLCHCHFLVNSMIAHTIILFSA